MGPGRTAHRWLEPFRHPGHCRRVCTLHVLRQQPNWRCDPTALDDAPLLMMRCMHGNAGTTTASTSRTERDNMQCRLAHAHTSRSLACPAAVSGKQVGHPAWDAAPHHSYSVLIVPCYAAWLSPGSFDRAFCALQRHQLLQQQQDTRSSSAAVAPSVYSSMAASSGGFQVNTLPLALETSNPWLIPGRPLRRLSARSGQFRLCAPQPARPAV